MGSIKLKSVTKSFGDTEVIPPLDLNIDDGEFVVFVGPSGCGKSTLLRLIAGLENTTSGKVIIDGQDVTDVTPSKRGLAMVFQTYALYPHMTVRKNIAFPLRMSGMDPAEIEKRVVAASTSLNLNDTWIGNRVSFQAANVNELPSGGLLSAILPPFCLTNHFQTWMRHFA